MSIGAEIDLWTDFLAEHILEQTLWEQYVQMLVPSFPMVTSRPLKLNVNDLEGQTYQPRASVRLSIVDTLHCVSALKM